MRHLAPSISYGMPHVRVALRLSCILHHMSCMAYGDSAYSIAYSYPCIFVAHRAPCMPLEFGTMGVFESDVIVSPLYYNRLHDSSGHELLSMANQSFTHFSGTSICLRTNL